MQRTPDDAPPTADDLPTAFDPSVAEDLLSEYRLEEWIEGDACPGCGGVETEEDRLELEAFEDDDFTVGPDPARVRCAECDTVLYQHPKWVIKNIMGDDYAYNEA